MSFAARLVPFACICLVACGGSDAATSSGDGGDSPGPDAGRPLDAGDETTRDGSTATDPDGAVGRADANVGAPDGEVIIEEDGGERTDGAAPADGGEQTDAADPEPGRPHPLYPAFDLDTLPGDGGGSSGAYQVPALPSTDRTVMIESSGFQAQDDVIEACAVAGTAVIVPSAVGRIPGLDLGSAEDCDITFGADVFIDYLVLGAPQTESPVHRVRIRGGQLGGVVVAHHSTDVVFDGVVINSAPLDAIARPIRGLYLLSDIDRFAFVSSIIRMAPTEAVEGSTDGSAVRIGNSRNVFFANNNIVTAGNRESASFNLRGGESYLIVDNTVRASFDAFVRLGGLGEDYVYIKGGTFMREATRSAANEDPNDTFVQENAYGSAQVFVRDLSVHLLSSERVTFGSAPFASSESGESWHVRRIAWHARSASVVTDSILLNQCFFDPPCDYGAGTHSYAYDAGLAFPASPWRTLPNIASSNPDDQPTAL